MPSKADQNKEFEAYLEQLYNEQGFMRGRDAIYRHLQTHRPDLLANKGGAGSRRKVMAWLQQQEVHQIFHPTRNLREIQSTVPSQPFALLAIDLIDARNIEYNKYCWVLTAIDMLSKKAHAVPLRSKSAEHVMRGFALLLYGNEYGFRINKHGSTGMAKWTTHKYKFKQKSTDTTPPQMKRHYRHIRSDVGPEFSNALFVTFLKQFILPERKPVQELPLDSKPTPL
eukprot:m.139596 g.139596  ORF g.139596 m.139596 type:complete len:226 (+) comp24076_c0_seq8:166-843(+)